MLLSLVSTKPLQERVFSGLPLAYSGPIFPSQENKEKAEKSGHPPGAIS